MYKLVKINNLGAQSDTLKKSHCQTDVNFGRLLQPMKRNSRRCKWQSSLERTHEDCDGDKGPKRESVVRESQEVVERLKSKVWTSVAEMSSP